MSLRLAFMGTPDFAVAALEALVASRHQVVVVYSQPPRPAGRGHKVQKSAVQEFAEARGIEVRHPHSLKPQEEKESFAALGLDCAVVAAYGLILPRAILDAPRYGCLNIHGSLLPRWRGAAPIQRAILAGDTETGITIMQMDTGMDTGAMLRKAAVEITPHTTTLDLYGTLQKMGAEMILAALDDVIAGKQPTPQPAGVTYADKLTREDGRLDFSKSAVELHRQIRALVPWPGTFFEWRGETIKVLAAGSL